MSSGFAGSPLFGMPVRGNAVLPSSDSDVDPAALAVAERMLAKHGCKRLPRLTTTQLAKYLGNDARTWRRRFELQEIDGFRRGREWIVAWPDLVRWVAESQNVVTLN